MVPSKPKARQMLVGALGIQKMQRNGYVSRWCSAKTEIVAGGGRERGRIRAPFGSGLVGIKCFFVVTFVSVDLKLQHLRQI